MRRFFIMVLHMMLLMPFVFKTLISVSVERMLHRMEKARISQQVQATVINIQNLTQKAVTTCLLRKFLLEDIQW